MKNLTQGNFIKKILNGGNAWLRHKNRKKLENWKNWKNCVGDQSDDNLTTLKFAICYIEKI